MKGVETEADWVTAFAGGDYTTNMGVEERIASRDITAVVAERIVREILTGFAHRRAGRR